MNFRSFSLFFFFLLPSPKAPSAQVTDDGVTQSKGGFIAVCIFIVGENNVKSPGANISRAGWGDPWEGNWLCGEFSALPL